MVMLTISDRASICGRRDTFSLSSKLCDWGWQQSSHFPREGSWPLYTLCQPPTPTIPVLNLFPYLLSLPCLLRGLWATQVKTMQVSFPDVSLQASRLTKTQEGSAIGRVASGPWVTSPKWASFGPRHRVWEVSAQPALSLFRSSWTKWYFHISKKLTI